MDVTKNQKTSSLQQEGNGNVSRSRSLRLLYFSLGLFSLVIAGIGVLLPMLPGTPFAIVAAACFARSSPTLQHKIEQSRLFGPAIRNWKLHGAISLQARVFATLLISVSVVVSLIADLPIWFKISANGLIALGLLFLWTRPYPPKL